MIIRGPFSFRHGAEGGIEPKAARADSEEKPPWMAAKAAAAAGGARAWMPEREPGNPRALKGI